jgi:DNA-binding NarL/FixJ family response regulator
MQGVKMSEIVYVMENGEKRKATADELTQMQQDKIASDALEAEIQAQKDARQSALAKLAALGLTEAEIAAL